MAAFLIARLPFHSKPLDAVEFMQKNHFPYRIFVNSPLMNFLMTSGGVEGELAVLVGPSEKFELGKEEERLVAQLMDIVKSEKVKTEEESDDKKRMEPLLQTKNDVCLNSNHSPSGQISPKGVHHVLPEKAVEGAVFEAKEVKEEESDDVNPSQKNDNRAKSTESQSEVLKGAIQSLPLEKVAVPDGTKEVKEEPDDDHPSKKSHNRVESTESAAEVPKGATQSTSLEKVAVRDGTKEVKEEEPDEVLPSKKSHNGVESTESQVAVSKRAIQSSPLEKMAVCDRTKEMKLEEDSYEGQSTEDHPTKSRDDLHVPEQPSIVEAAGGASEVKEELLHDEGTDLTSPTLGSAEKVVKEENPMEQPADSAEVKEEEEDEHQVKPEEPVDVVAQSDYQNNHDGFGNESENKDEGHRTLGSQVKWSLRRPSDDRRLLFVCPVKNCPSSFKNFFDLERHVKEHSDKESSFFCDVCKKDFPSVDDGLEHIRKRKTKECCGCKKRIQKLREHLLNHKDERPFECDECGKKYKRISHLKSHERTHSDEKRFKCEECPYRAHFNGDLTKHRRRMHERPN